MGASHAQTDPALPGDPPSGGHYVDPAQLDVPWGKHSYFHVPWRGYLQTLPATTWLDGIGMNWGPGVPGDPASAVVVLAHSGITRMRVEISWDNMDATEQGLLLSSQLQLKSLLAALAANHIRPLILLNGAPLAGGAPLQLAEAAPAGATSLHVRGDLARVHPWLATLQSPGVPPAFMNVMVTGVDAASGQLQLSRPLPKPLVAGQSLVLTLLRHPPLFQMGSPQYAESHDAWLRYVQTVGDFVTAAYGSDNFDVELWNELAYGSQFLDAASYLAERPKGWVPQGKNFVPGGTSWTLAADSIALLHARHPHVQAYWGFSNTTFFQTGPGYLPPYTVGQSYHPYGTGPMCFAKVETHLQANVEGAAPDYCATMAEGIAQTFFITESLIRLLRPDHRTQWIPPQSTSFTHIFSEEGFLPFDLGIRTDANAAWRAKAKYLLRTTLFWLNKGIGAVYLFENYAPGAFGYGYLGTDGGDSPALAALRHAYAFFGPADHLDTVRQLGVDERALSVQPAIYSAGPAGPDLHDRDVLAILPYQAAAHRFVVAVYVMSLDFPADHSPEPYAIRFTGVKGMAVHLRAYDPLEDKAVEVSAMDRTADSVTVRLDASDSPRLLELREDD